MAEWLQNLAYPASEAGDSGCRALTICDSAFGAGQRFVSVWQAWQASSPPGARLHYVGLDPLPGDASELASCWAPDSRGAGGAALLSGWQTPLPGISRLEFDEGRVSLTLLHMPLKQAVVQLMARVDVFLLDCNVGRLVVGEPGFSLFGQLARLANAGALVQACGGLHHEQIRRGLQRAGFICEPVVLPWVADTGAVSHAVDSSSWVQARLRPGLMHGARRVSSDRRVAVVGGGIAGAGVAHALALRGHEVHVFDAALGVSRQGCHAGHLGAAVTPAVSRDDDYRARLSRVGARLSWWRWHTLPTGARPVKAGTAVVTADPVEQARLREALQAGGFPKAWARWCTGDAPAIEAGLGKGRSHAWFSEGMVIRPGRLVEALLTHPGIEVQGCHVGRVSGGPGQWQLLGMEGQPLMSVSNVVMANAAGVVPLLRASGFLELPVRLTQMQAIAGQISYFDATRFSTSARCILDGEGYWLPPVDGLHIGGGTYDLEASQAQVTPEGHAQVVDKVCAVLGIDSAGPGSGASAGTERAELVAAIAGGWAGWRAVVPGRLPVIGELPGCQGVWLACAYGSRGLTWSALAGEVVAATLNDEPLPLERDLLRAIAAR